MIKWYLVLYIIGTSSSSMISIPQAYNDKQVCEEAAKDWDSWGSGQKHICIKVPVNINLNVPNLGSNKNCTCASGNVAVPCECSILTHTDNPASLDKGYVCQPGATTCEVVK